MKKESLKSEAKSNNKNKVKISDAILDLLNGFSIIGQGFSDLAKGLNFNRSNTNPTYKKYDEIIRDLNIKRRK